MSNWKERKRELERNNLDNEHEQAPLRVSYDAIEDEDDFQMIVGSGLSHVSQSGNSNYYPDDTYHDLNDESDGDDEDASDATTATSTTVLSEDLFTTGGHAVSGRYKINALELSLDSFSHASRSTNIGGVHPQQPQQQQQASVVLVTGHSPPTTPTNASSSSLTHGKMGSSDAQMKKQPILPAKPSPSTSGTAQNHHVRPLPTPNTLRRDSGATSASHMTKNEPAITSSTTVGKTSGSSMSAQDEIELLKQQVSQLQLKNMELMEALQLKSSGKKSIDDEDRDLFEVIEHDHVEYDNYFRSASAPSLPIPDETSVIKNGLFSCDLSRSVISANTRNYFYNRKDEDFEYDDDVNISKLKDEFCTVDLKYPHRYNLYDLDTKLMEKNQNRAWCDIRSLKSIKKKRRLMRACHYDKSKNYLNSDDNRIADNERFPVHYDALMAVLLDMEQSLTFREFMGCLAGDENRVYLDAYVGHLNRLRDYQQLMKVYRYHGMILQMLMLQFKMAMAIRDPGAKIQNIESIMSHFRLATPNNDIANYCQKHELFAMDFAKYFVDYINLLSRQVRIEEYDSAVARQGRELIYIENPRYNIINLPIADTLKYCLFYHPYAEDAKLSSPKNLAQTFRLARHRYIYEAARTRCRIKDWKAVELLYKTSLDEHLTSCSSYDFMNQKSTATSFLKSKFSGPKHSSYSILSITSFLLLAMQYRAPKGLIEVFIRQCPDPHEKYELARQNQLYQIAVDCAIKELKDKELCIRLNKELVEKLGAENSQELREQINQYIMKGEKKGWLRKLF